uniref:Uncharacterized protein n=1 Tax=Parascaris univalens TaxID=6257 RepID=A0A915CKP9_PARUN
MNSTYACLFDSTDKQINIQITRYTSPEQQPTTDQVTAQRIIETLKSHDKSHDNVRRKIGNQQRQTNSTFRSSLTHHLLLDEKKDMLMHKLNYSLSTENSPAMSFQRSTGVRLCHGCSDRSTHTKLIIATSMNV